LAVGDEIQEGIAGAGEKSVEAINKAQDFSDIPGYTEEKQTLVDEDQINQQFDPANNIMDQLREGGEWLFNMIADFISSLF